VNCPTKIKLKPFVVLTSSSSSYS